MSHARRAQAGHNCRLQNLYARLFRTQNAIDLNRFYPVPFSANQNKLIIIFSFLMIALTGRLLPLFTENSLSITVRSPCCLIINAFCLKFLTIHLN